MPVSTSLEVQVNLEAHQSIPLIQYLSKRFTYKDQLGWEKEIDSHRIMLNGQVCSEQSSVKNGDSIQYFPTPYVEPAVNFNYEILDEDSDLLIVNKPAPLPVYPIRRYYQNTLLKQLQKDFKNQLLFPVNRLDLETTGIVVFAKNKTAAAHLAQQFQAHMVKKIYLAAVFGKYPSGLDQLESFLKKEEKRPHYYESFEGKHAVTRVEVLSQTFNFSLLKLEPATGRTHQLRVQLSAKGYPIVGDKRYHFDASVLDQFLSEGFSKELEFRLEAKRQMLHAWKIKFIHPIKQTEVYQEAPVPIDFQNFLNEKGLVPRAGLEPAQRLKNSEGF